MKRQTVKIMKKLKLTAVVSAVCMCFGVCAFAEDIFVYLNGNRLEFDTQPVMENDRVLVPMRAIMENMGFDVQWSGEKKRATAFNDKCIISFIIDKNEMYINGEPKEIDVAPKIVNNRTLVPIRAFSEAADARVEWHGEEGAVYINTDIEPLQSCEEMAWELYEHTNRVREQNGLELLKWNDNAAYAGYLHCEEMAKRSYFDHINPEGISPFDRLKSLGIRYTYAAENIAAGQWSAYAAIEAFMSSESHRKNILDPNLRELGCAAYRGGDYGVYWAQEFITAD